MGNSIVSGKIQWQARGYFSVEIFICRGWQRFAAKLQGFVLIHIKGLVKISVEHPYLPQTCQVLLDLLSHSAQVTEQFAQQAGPIAEAFLILGPSQN